jgi:hypothetical protein
MPKKETPEARKARHERRMARMRADPEYAKAQNALGAAAKKRYEQRKRMARESAGPVGSGKPGRIVALCGWMNW